MLIVGTTQREILMIFQTTCFLTPMLSYSYKISLVTYLAIQYFCQQLSTITVLNVIIVLSYDKISTSVFVHVKLMMEIHYQNLVRCSSSHTFLVNISFRTM